jgi:hypothetical protein
MGRRVGNRLRGRDVLSEYALRRHRFQVDRLDQYDRDEESWQEIVVEDRRATPAEIVATRLDFSEWLKRLPGLRRQIALALASGETTKTTAEKFGVSHGRISQLRQWFRRSWEAFHGGEATENYRQPAVT